VSDAPRLRVRLVAIVDLPDGSLMLPPNPARVRSLRLVFRAGAVVTIGLGLVLLAVTLVDPKVPATVRFLTIPFLVVGATDWFLWQVITPRGLKADAMELTYLSLLERRRMPRSDVGQILRGQVIQRGRGGAQWVKSYVFATSDGQVGLSCAATWFTDDGMSEFARRLQVPIKGDFTAQVKDRVDPTSA
jgi:hypothetical protein